MGVFCYNLVVSIIFSIFVSKFNNMETLVTKKELCSLLGVSRATLDNMIRAEVIPRGFKIKSSKYLVWHKSTVDLLCNNKDEKWLPVVGYEGLYEVSNFGRVKNKRGRFVSQSVQVSGYKRVTLSKNNKYSMKLVHRLVAEAFIPNPNNYAIVNHKDENKLNNIVTNLEWCTQSYNTTYSKTSTITKRHSKNKILRVATDGSDVTVYHSIAGAARANNIDSRVVKNIIDTTRVYENNIWIKLVTS